MVYLQCHRHITALVLQQDAKQQNTIHRPRWALVIFDPPLHIERSGKYTHVDCHTIYLVLLLWKHHVRDGESLQQSHVKLFVQGKIVSHDRTKPAPQESSGLGESNGLIQQKCLATI